MRDAEIRLALVGRLREAHSDLSDTWIRTEMPLCLGASRVDVCLINGNVTGFEIKSPRDTLARLPAQVCHYSKVLDFAVVVGAPRFVRKLEDVVPEWWGIQAVTRSTDRVEFVVHRQPLANPSPDPESLAQMLWREEAWQELVDRGLHHGLARATRWRLWDTLVEALTREELQEVVRKRLKARLSAAAC